MVLAALLLASVAVLGSGVGGCAQQENVILLEVQSPTDVGDLTITVIPLDRTAPPSSVVRPVNQTAAQIRETPLRIAIRLGGPREAMVVLSAPGVGGSRLVGQRCFAVAGVVRDSVWLVELGATEDADGDGYPRRPVVTCARPPAAGETAPVTCASDDPYLCSAMGESDCDDDDASRYPSARDLCGNTLDEDCDGADATCEDTDGDGFRPCRMSEDPSTCDCGEGNPLIFPGAEDPCGDSEDGDCDGADDRCDQDCDGFPDGSDAESFSDCDETDAAVHPDLSLDRLYGLADGDRLARGCPAMPTPTSSADTCTMVSGEPVGDGIDNDCNRFVDDGAGCTDVNDRDRDGARACPAGTTRGCDLNDCDPGIGTVGPEICGNDFDENSDGVVEPCAAGDSDGDGQVAMAMGGDDCDDTNPQIFLGAPEVCTTPSISESCTENIACGSSDTDGDGYISALPGVRGDCDDTSAAIRPFAAEDPCDGRDNDCDGIVDEVLDPATAGFPQGTEGCVRAGGSAAVVSFTESAAASEYCGGCGVTTDANEDCCAGVRTAVDEPGSCGGCGVSCGPHTACPMTGSDAGGNEYGCACAPDAAGDWGDCNGTLGPTGGGDGCESDMNTDELNCGRCGNRCGMNQTCIAGACTCDAPYLDCDGMQLTGCEVNGSNDVNNCRTCGNVCRFASGSPECSAGACRLASCEPGFDDCNRMDPDGCETPLTTLGNCGACGELCGAVVNAVESCNGSRRCDYTSCDAGWADCNMIRPDGCERSITTTTNCGACGNACGTSEVCNGSGDCQCGTGPSAGSGAACTGATPNCCGNACVNLMTDVNNCGGCGVRCGAGEACSGGRCGCGTGPRAGVGAGAACTGATPNCCNNACVNVMTNTGNCGACSNVCGPSETCGAGQCTCGTTRGTTGAGEACSGAGNECCGSSCTDVRSTVGSCGACGTSCTSTVVNAVETCTASTCGYSSCDPNWGDCSGGMANGCETNLLALPNCGACGQSCAAIANAVEVCSSGSCDYSSCDANWLDCTGGRANGCETDGRLLGNCGSCGNTCPGVLNAVEICASGSCDYSSCDAGWLDCSGGRANGCESSRTSFPNCGTCGNTCAGVVNVVTTTCVGAGTCSYTGGCDPGFDDCNSIVTDGCEASISSVTACGNCTTNCNTQVLNVGTRICSGGTTCDYTGSCTTGFGDCSGGRSNGCETPLNTLSNCGSCGETCSGVQNATAICSASRTCDYSSCNMGFGDCTGGRSNGCETTLGTVTNCGSCGHACGPMETCNAMGQCQCGASGPTSGTGEACTGATPDCNPTAMMGTCQ